MANDSFHPRHIDFVFNGAPLRLSQQASLDTDHDELPDSWERQFGLAVTAYADAFNGFNDPDLDGRNNAEELQAGTHPTGKAEYSLYLAEGASGVFDTLLAIANFGNEPARVMVSVLGAAGVLQRLPAVVPAQSPLYIDLSAQSALSGTAFGLAIESTAPVVVDRVQAIEGGGMHAERAVGVSEMRGGRDWLIAEGTTASGFNLFYLIANPNDTPVDVDLTYYFAAPLPPRSRTFSIPAMSRHTIWVNHDGPDVIGRDVSARLRSSAPIVAEYALYRTANAGGRTAALAARAHPVVPWGYHVFAEGATGAFFDTFLAIVNSWPMPMTVSIRYLLPDGRSIMRTHQLAPTSRQTIWVDQDPELADTAFGLEVAAMPGIAVQRTMLWPGDVSNWYEGHTSGTATLTTEAYAAWGLSSSSTECYYLLVNPQDSPALVDVTLLLEAGDVVTRALLIDPGARLNVPIAAFFPEAYGSRFATRITARGLGGIAVDQSTYQTPSGGPPFARGTSTPLRSVQHP